MITEISEIFLSFFSLKPICSYFYGYVLFFCKLPRLLYNKAFGERVYFRLLYHTTYETGITVVPSFQL